MTIRLWERRRRATAYALVGAVAALLITALAIIGALPGLPASWWPKTGSAFAATSGEPSMTSAADGSDACDAVVGPAHGYCLGAPAPNTAPDHLLTLAGLWPLGVLAVGITALYLVTRRTRGL